MELKGMNTPVEELTFEKYFKKLKFSSKPRPKCMLHFLSNNSLKLEATSSCERKN